MDSPYAIAQLIVIALLGAGLVVLALWDEKRTAVVDRYKDWKDTPEGHKPTRTELGKLR